MTSGEHLLVADKEGEFVDAVVSLLHDRDRWQALSENGRDLVRARYVAEIAYRPLDEAVARLGGARS